jgi:hypothetical protein
LLCLGSSFGQKIMPTSKFQNSLTSCSLYVLSSALITEQRADIISKARSSFSSPSAVLLLHWNIHVSDFMFIQANNMI